MIYYTFHEINEVINCVSNQQAKLNKHECQKNATRVRMSRLRVTFKNILVKTRSSFQNTCACAIVIYILYTQSMISTRMSVSLIRTSMIATLTSVILIRKSVISTSNSVNITQECE
jgi:hypothetical protein